jgi:hypothetical protein
MNEYGAMVEWYWQGKTEVMGEKLYAAWVVNGWMRMEQWCNNNDSGKQKCLVQNVLLVVSENRTHPSAARSPKKIHPYPFSLCIYQRLYSTLWFQSRRTFTSPTNTLFKQSISVQFTPHILPFTLSTKLPLLFNYSLLFPKIKKQKKASFQFFWMAASGSSVYCSH